MSKSSTFPASRPARRRSAAGPGEAASKAIKPITWPTKRRVRGKNKLHLKTDPPPDLAIEAVHSHDADAAIEVYRRFKVPEVWVCDEAELRILILQTNGRYAESPTSAAFPFLSAAEVYDWVRRSQVDPGDGMAQGLSSLGPATSSNHVSETKTEAVAKNEIQQCEF